VQHRNGNVLICIFVPDVGGKLYKHRQPDYQLVFDYKWYFNDDAGIRATTAEPARSATATGDAAKPASTSCAPAGAASTSWKPVAAAAVAISSSSRLAPAGAPLARHATHAAS